MVLKSPAAESLYFYPKMSKAFYLYVKMGTLQSKLHTVKFKSTFLGQNKHVDKGRKHIGRCPYCSLGTEELTTRVSVLIRKVLKTLKASNLRFKRRGLTLAKFVMPFELA